MVELCTHPASERAGLETLHLQVRAPVLDPTGGGPGEKADRTSLAAYPASKF